MDRRNFIKALTASGVLGASPLAARAASELFASGTAQPVLIVSQTGLAQAAELAVRLQQLLAAAGVKYQQAAASGPELAQFSHVTALLDRVTDGRVIGFMDDAAAAIFQELAAARGAACVVSTHHRFVDQEVRHCCTAAERDASIAWTDARPSHAQRISRLYAGMLGGSATASGDGAAVAPVGLAASLVAAPASLVSFLIKT